MNDYHKILLTLFGVVRIYIYTLDIDPPLSYFFIDCLGHTHSSLFVFVVFLKLKDVVMVPYDDVPCVFLDVLC